MATQPEEAEGALQSRRDFLIGLGKWSRVVIAGAVVGGGALLGERSAQAGAWVNRRGCCGGGGWINGGGGGWVNRRGGWGGGSWINRR
ncbi:MAG: hypothetical protein H6971_01760 [Gammaproteobacteria bacterium]|nr:hypothetical protein [Gammaproteobacteria bacterium]